MIPVKPQLSKRQAKKYRQEDSNVLHWLYSRAFIKRVNSSVVEDESYECKTLSGQNRSRTSLTRLKVWPIFSTCR
jgi:hypothetical protein